MEENITDGNAEKFGVQLGCARNKEAGSLERGTSAMTRDHILDEIQALLWKLDAQKLRIVYQFIKSLIS